LAGQGVPARSGYFAATLVGYCVGLTVCEVRGRGRGRERERQRKRKRETA
jgi:hypothetical protein